MKLKNKLIAFIASFVAAGIPDAEQGVQSPNVQIDYDGEGSYMARMKDGEVDISRRILFNTVGGDTHNPDQKSLEKLLSNPQFLNLLRHSSGAPHICATIHEDEDHDIVFNHVRQEDHEVGIEFSVVKISKRRLLGEFVVEFIQMIREQLQPDPMPDRSTYRVIGGNLLCVGSKVELQNEFITPDSLLHGAWIANYLHPEAFRGERGYRLEIFHNVETNLAADTTFLNNIRTQNRMIATVQPTTQPDNDTYVMLLRPSSNILEYRANMFIKNIRFVCPNNLSPHYEQRIRAMIEKLNRYFADEEPLDKSIKVLGRCYEVKRSNQLGLFFGDPSGSKPYDHQKTFTFADVIGNVFEFIIMLGNDNHQIGCAMEVRINEFDDDFEPYYSGYSGNYF